MLISKASGTGFTNLFKPRNDPAEFTAIFRERADQAKLKQFLPAYAADSEIMRVYTHINNATSQAAMTRLAAANTEIRKKPSGLRLAPFPRRPGRGSAQIQHTRRSSKNDRGAK